MILKVIPQWFLSDSSGDPPRPPRCILPIASSLLIIITTCHQVIHYFYRLKNQRKIPFKILQSFSNMSPQNIISKKNPIVRLLYPLVHPGHYNTYSPYLTYSLGHPAIPYTPNLQVRLASRQIYLYPLTFTATFNTWPIRLATLPYHTPQICRWDLHRNKYIRILSLSLLDLFAWPPRHTIHLLRKKCIF